MKTNLKTLVRQLVKEVLEHELYTPMPTDVNTVNLAQAEEEIAKFLSQKLAEYMIKINSEHGKELGPQEAKKVLPEVIWDLFEHGEIPNVEDKSIETAIKQLEREQNQNLSNRIAHEAFRLYKIKLQLDFN